MPPGLAGMIFDNKAYQDLNASRWAIFEPAIKSAKAELGLETALDLGCGTGHFTKVLSDLGFRASGIDGREGNVAEARRRHPDLSFQVMDAEDLEIPPVDMIFCVGLMYHLENPFRMIRRLRACTRKIAFIETHLIQDLRPTMLLVSEGETEDQGLNRIAFWYSESCLVSMLRHAGFSKVSKLGSVSSRGIFLASCS